MKSRCSLLVVCLWLGACAQQAPVASPPTAAAPGASNTKASRVQFTAVVRGDSFLASLSAEERAKAISEPLGAGLIIVYMVDQHGVARLAEPKDLADSGVTRDALRSVAEWNIAATLPNALSCEKDTINQLPAGSFYQSSRLLLSAEWSALAAKKGQITVGVPSNDTLLVTCAASAATVDKLATAIQNTYPRAAHPVSPALLRWTPDGWKELKRPE